MHQRAILWFRNDLRLHDNVALCEAIQKSHHVYLVYCFDPRDYAETAIGLPKTGPYRAKFLLESLQALKDNLQAIGSDLIIRQGIPEHVIPQLAKEIKVQAVFASKEVVCEEMESALEKKLASEGIALSLVWQSTLLHVDDIPWPIRNVPDVFSQFRKEAEGVTPVREMANKPCCLPPLDMEAGSLPSLEDLGLETARQDERAVLPYKGGETAALQRLQQYLWDHDCLKAYKETRDGLLGADYSSKFSAWLANGSLSPRMIYREVKRYEQERTKNRSTYWLIFELLWRDYFRFVAKKYGNKLLQPEGLKDKPVDQCNDEGSFKRWKNAETGVPFIDANMRELNATGFLSNRGRQNVASFLIKDLRVNWTWGALYFESLLIDHDVSSNWGNWSYIAGVGNDPRENRYFNIMSQAKRYDPRGEYVRYWIPELSDLPGKKIHYPTALPAAELAATGISIGKDYPKPMVDFQKWLY